MYVNIDHCVRKASYYLTWHLSCFLCDHKGDICHQWLTFGPPVIASVTSQFIPSISEDRLTDLACGFSCVNLQMFR